MTDTTADTHDTDLTDAQADALSAVASAEQKESTARAVAALASPLDQAMRRGNPRPRVSEQSLFDVHDEMQTPNMAFDPAQIVSHEAFEELNGWNTDQSIAAMETMHNAAKNLLTAREAYRSDPTMTEAAQVLAIDSLHMKLSSQVLPKIDAARANLEKTIASHEAQLRQPVADGARGAFAAEVRAMVRGMSVSERQSFITQAVNNGDAVATGAILGAPSYLSGLDAKMAQVFTERANTLQNPTLVKQLALMKHSRDKLERAGSLFVANTEAMTGFRHTTAERLRAQQKKLKTVLGAVVPQA
jgi:hypothetical protein